MPFADLDGCRIHYELEGAKGLPLLILSNSLGTNLHMWHPQLQAFSQSWRVLRYDTRGHGESSVTPGPHTIQQLAQDVIRLLDTLNEPNAFFCGLSLGGLTGMWLGIHHSDRIRKLVLCNTSAHIGTPELWNSRIEAVRTGGMQAIAASVVARWFSAEFRAGHPDIVQSFQQSLSRTPPDGYIGGCCAIRDTDLRSSISTIRVPTAIVAGAYDPATTPAEGRYLAEQIARAKYIELPAAHLSNVECSAEFTHEISKFLSSNNVDT